MKLLADDLSFFSAVHDVSTSGKVLNGDLKKVSEWAFQWKMSFNTDPSKQAQEFIFGCKSKGPTHLTLVFNISNISRSLPQKHLGVILDFRLIFEDHLNNVLAKINKAEGLQRKL